MLKAKINRWFTLALLSAFSLQPSALFAAALNVTTNGAVVAPSNFPTLLLFAGSNVVAVPTNYTDAGKSVWGLRLHVPGIGADAGSFDLQTNAPVVGPVTNQWDASFAGCKSFTNDAGMRTNCCFQLTNVVTGVETYGVIYGGILRGSPTNEFLTNWFTWPGGGKILWCNCSTGGWYDFALRTNLSAVVRFFAARNTNVFATWQTNNAPY